MRHFHRMVQLDDRGFTLVELLIVIGIIGVLAAIIVPNFTGLIGQGEEAAAAAELTTLQTAMDTMMAVEGISTITSTHTDNATATEGMADFPNGTTPLYPNYVRTQLSGYEYYCDSGGTVFQGAQIP